MMIRIWGLVMRALAAWIGAFVLLNAAVDLVAPHESLLYLLWNAEPGSLWRTLTALLTGGGLWTVSRTLDARTRDAGLFALIPGALWAARDAVRVWQGALSGELYLSGTAWLPGSALFAVGLVLVAVVTTALPLTDTRPRTWRWLLGAPLLPLALSWHIATVGSTEHLRGGDTAVVFGAGLKDNGEASDVLYDRVLTGVRLYHEGRIEQLVMTGAAHPGIPSEPVVMRDLAIVHGVPAEAIVLDEHGDNTAASLRNLAQTHPEARLLMVSNDHHLARIQLGCQRTALRCTMVPAYMRLVPLHESWYRVREVLGFTWYALTFR